MRGVVQPGSLLGAVAVLLLHVAVAACGGPVGANEAATVAPATRPPVTVTAPADPDSPRRTSTPAPPSWQPSTGPGPGVTGPPRATLLRSATRETVAGTPGSFSWEGLVSDAPWISGAPTSIVRGERLAVSFEPRVIPVEWQVRWTPLVADQPGTALDGDSGSGEPITLRAPPASGPWSLMVTAGFGQGRRASWTWSVDLSP